MYRVPLIPGPTTVPPEVLAASAQDYPSADLEAEFFELYAETERRLRSILRTDNQIAVMTGEAMVALWGGLKSCLRPGDRVLCVASGLFGSGFAEMAKSIGCETRLVESPWDTFPEPAEIERAIVDFRPKMVTAVHCETPSGILTPIGVVGELVRRHDVPLFLVDAVASAGGAPLETDAWRIDLALVGSQKCLSAPPSMAIVAVSERAWAAADEVGYRGYDALSPWRRALAERYFPYTPNWHGTAAVHAAAGRILDEGLDATIRRHADVARRCRDGGRAIGLELYAARADLFAPTVTAFKVPERIGWDRLKADMRARGIGAGGNWGPLAGQVFRLGHMGVQADPHLIDEAMLALREILAVPATR